MAKERVQNDREKIKKPRPKKPKVQILKGPKTKSELPAPYTPHGAATRLVDVGRVAIIEIHGPRGRGVALRGGPIEGVKIISEAHSVGIDTL